MKRFAASRICACIQLVAVLFVATFANYAYQQVLVLPAHLQVRHELTSPKPSSANEPIIPILSYRNVRYALQ